MIKIALLLALTLTGCVTDDAAPIAERPVHAECGPMPYPEPGWSLTSYPGTTGQVCMTDANYIARDRYHQDVVDWARCVELVEIER